MFVVFFFLILRNLIDNQLLYIALILSSLFVLTDSGLIISDLEYIPQEVKVLLIRKLQHTFIELFSEILIIL